MNSPPGATTNRLLFRDIARFRAKLFDRMFEHHGLTSSQAGVINVLGRENGLTQSELALRLDIGAVAAGGLVERLEARGLVTRRVDPNDRRANRVHLTDASLSLLDSMNQTIDIIDGIAYGGLSAEEIATLEAMLERVRLNLVNAVKLVSASNTDAPTSPLSGG